MSDAMSDAWHPGVGLPNGDRPAGRFVETRPYRRFAEFCETCRYYRWIGVCAGNVGVGKTISSRAYTHWDKIEPLLTTYLSHPDTVSDLNDCHTVLYTTSQTDGPRMVATHVTQLRLALSYLIADSTRASTFAHIFRALAAEETTAVVFQHASALRTSLCRDDFPDPEAIAHIVRATNGNFRLLEKLLGQIERILLLSRSDPSNAGKRVVVTRTVVDLAAEQLILGTD